MKNYVGFTIGEVPTSRIFSLCIDFITIPAQGTKLSTVTYYICHFMNVKPSNLTKACGKKALDMSYTEMIAKLSKGDMITLVLRLFTTKPDSNPSPNP